MLYFSLGHISDIILQQTIQQSFNNFSVSEMYEGSLFLAS